MSDDLCKTTAEGRYEALAGKRDIFLNRAVECAAHTIPSIISINQDTSGEILQTPWQSIGARGVNNLTSKLLLALFPPNEPFFKLQVEEFVLEQLAQANGVAVEDIKSDYELGLNKISRVVMDDMEASATRVDIHEALKNLLICGNCLIYIPPAGRIKVFQLNRYCCRRDAMGTPVEIVVKETFSPRSLEKKVQDYVGVDLDKDEDIAVFTYLVRKEDKWEIYQECKGKKLPGTSSEYSLDNCPWLALRGIKRNGEDYGRSYVEEYLGDLKSLDSLCQALVEGACAAARVLFLVNPNGTTNVRTLMKTRNLGFAPGNPDEVKALQIEKYYDFKTAHDAIGKIEERLSYAFLLNTAVQRSGDRVTAEEIRFVAQELEDQQGGVYSILSQELQLPLARVVMARLTKAKKIPPLPKDTVKPTVVTGIQALGRGHDRMKLDSFLTGLAQTLGPEVVGRYVNLGEAIKRRAIADGIDTQGLIKTEDQIAQESRQQQMQAMAQNVAPDAIKQAMANMAPKG